MKDYIDIQDARLGRMLHLVSNIYLLCFILLA